MKSNGKEILDCKTQWENDYFINKIRTLSNWLQRKNFRTKKHIFALYLTSQPNSEWPKDPKHDFSGKHVLANAWGKWEKGHPIIGNQLKQEVFFWKKAL